MCESGELYPGHPTYQPGGPGEVIQPTNLLSTNCVLGYINEKKKSKIPTYSGERGEQTKNKIKINQWEIIQCGWKKVTDRCYDKN